MLRDADPCHAIATGLDDDAAHLMQQFRLVGRTHQHLVAAAQCPQGAVEPTQRAFGLPSIGNVDKAGAQQPRVFRRQPNERHLTQPLLSEGAANPPLIGDFLAGQSTLVMIGKRLRDRSRIGLFGRIEMLRPVFEQLVLAATEQPLGSLVR